MVLGLRSKHRKDGSVQVNYVIHVQEIKPWPPLKSLESAQTVLLQCEIGDQAYGSFTSIVGDAKIAFNESFTLTSTLHREKRSRDKFKNNYLEFHLYEPRKDKADKWQFLGSAIINLADYGIFDNVLAISSPLNCKKSSKIAVQPVLFVKIQSINKDGSNTSSMGSLSKDSKQSSLDTDGKEAASEIINEEIDDEDEIDSFTDDDISTHSSHTAASSAFEPTGHSPSQLEKDVMDSTERADVKLNLPLTVEPTISALDTHHIKPSNNPNGDNSSRLPEKTMTSISKERVAPFLQSSFSTMGYQGTNRGMNSSEHENANHGFHEESVSNVGKLQKDAQQPVKNDFVNKVAEDVESLDGNVQVGRNSNIADSTDSRNGELKSMVIQEDDMDKREQRETGKDEKSSEKRQFSEDNLVGKFLASRKPDRLRSNTLASGRKGVGVQGSTPSNNKLKHLKSVQIPKANVFSGNGHMLGKANKSVNPRQSEMKEPKNESSPSRIEVLEDELRETAAIEASLYSIVAEHGSSTNKVHAPARRLSRFYLHACQEERSQEKGGNAARAIISGLVLVSKACGNDVPRLTFWLSNSVMLRIIVIQAVGELPLVGSKEEFDDWNNPETLVIALEKVEAWIFSRIVESVWWQALTPHMQSMPTSTSSKSMGPRSKKTSGSKHASSNQQQGNFSIELWNRAFKDASERLCPIRAGGHECGCLPVLARSVMEQLVSRLDVAMFNAILRESGEEMPTDPLSDPIGDLRVLPVPAGKSSFGAGAQLKNAIGSWSRWLTDLFGIEDNDSPEDGDTLGNDKESEFDTSFKPFRLLNSLSDLMMLPFEMLADKSTRKEVCPTFSAEVIKRVASYFVPDEFCPTPIPNMILEALDAEDDTTDVSEDSLTSFPCLASPTTYSPPPAASLSGIVGEVGSQALRRSGSSVLKKSYTSDDELDELDSPLASIITDTCRVPSAVKRPNWVPKGGRSILRYQLLREVWKHGEY